MIESYTFGSITVNGKKYSTDVIIYPDRIDSDWWRKEGHELCPEDIQQVLKEKPETLIVGTGEPGMMKVLPETKRLVQGHHIELIIFPTSEAIRIYNEISKTRRTVAAFHLTC